MGSGLPFSIQNGVLSGIYLPLHLLCPSPGFLRGFPVPLRHLPFRGVYSNHHGKISLNPSLSPTVLLQWRSRTVRTLRRPISSQAHPIRSQESFLAKGHPTFRILCRSLWQCLCLSVRQITSRRGTT